MSVYRRKGLVCHHSCRRTCLGVKTLMFAITSIADERDLGYVILSEIIRLLEITESEVLSPCVLVLMSLLELDNAHEESSY